MLLPIMTTPMTSRSTTMIATLFSTSHSRSLSKGARIRAGATRWATTGTATVDVAIVVNTTMTTAARKASLRPPNIRHLPRIYATAHGHLCLMITFAAD
jgi:hypothetical protein